MVKIVADTTAGLSADIVQRYHIPVVPQTIIFGREAYLEGVEIDQSTFLQRLHDARELPKTAAPSPELFAREFEKLLPSGEPILCIHPSSELSGTVRAASMAARGFPSADIRVIDTRVIASPLATMVTLAAQWAEEGCDADTIVERLRSMSERARVYFVVATLKYLAMGGRIGGAAALIGTMLQVKPILTLVNGRVEQYARERTHSRALAHLRALVLREIPRSPESYPAVMHANAPDEAAALATELAGALGIASIPILDVPPAIVTHGGPGILGVSFFVAPAAEQSQEGT